MIPNKQPKSVLQKVPAQGVMEFHNSSDVDSSGDAQHHTLGKGAMQAAPGNHDHDDDYADIAHNHDLVYSPLGHTHPDHQVLGVAGGLTANNLVGFSAWWGVSLMVIDADYTGVTDTGSNNFRIDVAGRYEVKFSAGFATAGGTLRGARILKNGTSVAQGRSGVIPGFEPTAGCTWDGTLAVNDVITFQVFQDSGANINLVFPEGLTRFAIIRRSS